MGKITKKRVGPLMSLFAMAVVLIVVFNSFYYVFTENNLLKKEFDILIEDGHLKSEKINTYISQIKASAQNIQESSEVKELLRQELVFNESAIKTNVDERARVISDEATNYLKSHPYMTLKDLQKSEAFRDIVIQPVSRSFRDIIVQPVGKKGYSFAYDTHTLINYFHKESRRVGYDYHEMKNSFPELWDIFRKTSLNGSAEGTYYRDEVDGNVSHKYGKFVQISVPTADGIEMSLGATAYTEDYKTIIQNSDYLRSIKENSDYYNLMLISSDGSIVYTTKPSKILGTNLEWEVNSKEGLSKHYFKTKETKDISFHGPYMGSYGDIYPKFSLMAPIYDEDDLLGYVVIENEMKKIFEITRNNNNLSETGQSYLIDENKLLISPLRNQEFDIMVQSVNTENADECIEDLEEKKEKAYEEEFKEKPEERENIKASENYKGDAVLGTDFPFPDVNWCLITEINSTEVLDVSLKDVVFKNIYFSTAIIVILAITGFFIVSFPCGIRGGFRPLYCKMDKKPNAKLKLRYIFLLALASSLGYFFLITLFFQGWKDDPLLNNLPDLLILIVAIVILVSSVINFSKSKVRRYFIWGSGLIVIEKILELPIQEYQAETNSLNPVFWIILGILSFFGFLFLLFGIKNTK